MLRRIRWILPLSLTACASPKPATKPAAAELADQLTRLLDSAYAGATNVPGLMLRVESPVLSEPWTGAVGWFDQATKEPLQPTHSVRVASQTKTFVAVAALRAVEQGKLALDSTIAGYLAPESVRELRGGGYDPGKITVRQVLQHVSGIFDYGMTPQYLEAIMATPSHRWSRLEQVKFAIDHGKPVGAPGASYHYSDTGYILLGEILERLQGKPLGQAVRELVGFERLGLRHTYFETLDSVPPGTAPRAHQYADTVDTYKLDASHDLWGGGGIVSNLEELARFYRALVRGELFDKKETLEAMLTVTPESERAMGSEYPPKADRERMAGYGMGLAKSMIGDLTCYGHGGFWGTLARYCPSADLMVVAAMNRTPDSAGTLSRLVFEAIRRSR